MACFISMEKLVNCGSLLLETSHITNFPHTVSWNYLNFALNHFKIVLYIALSSIAKIWQKFAFLSELRSKFQVLWIDALLCFGLESDFRLQLNQIVQIKGNIYYLSLTTSNFDSNMDPRDPILSAKMFFLISKL